MRRTIHVATIVVLVWIASSAVFGTRQPPPTAAAQAENRRGRSLHDQLSNAEYSASMDPNGTATTSIRAGNFQFDKSIESSGTTTLRLTQDDDLVTIVVDATGYVVRRGDRVARLDPRSTSQREHRDAIRSVLLGSVAVRSYRRVSVVLESRDEREDEHPLVLNALADGALIQMLDGDPGAMSRIARRVVRKQLAKVRQARMPDIFKDCVALYESSLLNSWSQYEQCMQWASNVTWWFADWAEDFCHWEWFLRSQQYVWQFVGCFTLP